MLSGWDDDTAVSGDDVTFFVQALQRIRPARSPFFAWNRLLSVLMLIHACSKSPAENGPPSLSGLKSCLTSLHLPSSAEAQKSQLRGNRVPSSFGPEKLEIATPPHRSSSQSVF